MPTVGDGSGLAAALTAEQLQQCYGAVFQRLQMLQQKLLAGPTFFQKDVAAKAVLLFFVLTDSVKQEKCVDDFVLIDTYAETVFGGKLAIEADGPHHFRHPDGLMTGSTLNRNRALQARGYVAVSVPVDVWDSCPESRKPELLQQLIQEPVSSNFISF
jgi:hypothetical protein